MNGASRNRAGGTMFAALSALILSQVAASAAATCTRTVVAKVVALDQAFYVNRFGALQAGGMIFALERDIVSMDGGNELQPGKVMVRPDRRPRPLTLRVDKGDCVEIQFHNLLSETPVSQTKGSIPTLPPSGYQPNQQVLGPANDKNGDQLQPPTRYAGVHVAGLEWAGSSSDDGTFVGANDTAAAGGTLNGLVAPGERIAYRLYAPEEGTFLLTSGGATVGERLSFGGQLSQGMFGSVIVEPPNAEFYRSQVSRDDLDAATAQSRQLPEGWSLSGRGQGCEYYKGTLKACDLTRDPTDPQDPNRGRSCVTVVDKDGNPVLDPINTNGYLHTLGDQPVLDYGAVFGHGAKRAGLPVLSMLAGRRGDSRRELVSSDLTAIITGPFAWTFGTSPPQEPNETYPEANQPYREFAIHYHDDFMATQAFAAFRDGGMQYTLQGGRDFFAINYGMGAIGASLWANRVQMGPASECATCKFEEFFLSSWPNGDPAMVLDQPVNVAEQKPPQASKATKAFYPDDPSNVYHSYLRDHVKFRILNAGTNITHVHHQHAHQWLHSPKSGLSAYRDSQMISPGAAYTLDMVYGGSGNKNLTVGDSIFHCHFYPHFAQGMWALWRVHDVFERGTLLGPDGEAIPGFNRALPDGEIARGTPIPGLVPLPTLAMALVPARVEIKTVTSTVNGKTLTRNEIAVNQDDLKAGREPGYPFFVPGLAGQRAPHPPMSYAPQLDDKGNQVEVAGEKQTLDGGLPRNLVVAELGSTYEQHNRWDFSKDSDVLWARQLDEEGTPEERAAMKTFSVRNHPSYTAVGTPIPFVYNGQPPVRGGPFANPAVHYNGDPVKVCDPSRNGCNGKDFDGQKLTYKGVDIQTDVVLNKEGWHYPQQRFSLLWEDVKPTLDGKKRPEPLFFRANSGDVVEFWLSNLIPSHYDLDDFQVRTPTDVVGQHIHLVKFDVLASDGAANGFNYEEGTLAAEEVRGLIGAINKADGVVQPDGRQKMLAAKSIPEFEKQFNKNDPLIIGAQATVELWYADPLTDLCLPGDQKETCSKQPIDRTIGTVFTHDHFGPSTHQQAGLYAGLIVEPRNSEWLTTASLDPMGGVDPKTGNPIVNRADGGPTSWAAVIDDGTSRHREYALEFQDRQLTYTSASKSQPKPYQRYQPATVGLVNLANPNGPWGWSDSAASVNAPNDPGSSTGLPPYPQLITNTFGSGAWSLNYRNEPLDFRLSLPSNKQTSIPNATDTALGFASIARNDPLLNTQPTGPIQPCAGSGMAILGDSDSTGVFWSVNGKKLQINGTVALKAGQVVCFGIKSKTHGLLFPDQQTAEALFDIKGSPQASKFKLNPNGPNTCQLQNSYGTAPISSGVIAVLRVLKDVTLDQPAHFECSQHCAAMAGMFTVRDALTIAGGQDASGKNVWFVDGKPMPNGETLQLKAGQLVQFSVQKGKHGLLFKSQSAAEALFDISHSPQAGKFVPNPNGPNTCQLTQSYGTVPQAFVSDGDNTIAELRVLKDAKVTGVVDFECSQHCANMLGFFALNPVLNVAADQDADNPHFWVVDGKMMPNGKTLELSPGQRVRFTVKNGTHGLLFADKATADAIFDIATSPQASKFVTNPRGAKTGTCNLAGSYGTVPQAAVTNPQPGDNTIAELVVKQAVTLSTPGQWMCSQHCQAMQGLFVPENTGFIVADTKNTRWLTNNEPLANNTSVPLAPGQKIRVSATGTGDQLFFPDKTAPAKLFGDASGFTPMTKCSVDGAGLNLNSDGTYSELTVKDPPTLSSAAFMSAQMCQKMEGLFQPDTPVPPFAYPQAFEGAAPFDPYTPLLRAYPGETVEIRTLVGAHMAPHSFNMHGVKWLFEQNSPNSGFRSTQGMGISEYYQMRFEVPATNSGADYLYASTSDTKGLEYGQWGLLRAYNQPQPDLPALGTEPAKTANVCASDAPPKSTYRVSAVSANQVLPGGTLLYNTRGLPGSDGEGKIFGEGALIYVNDEDLDVSADGIKMKPGRRVEPLVLRAAAGDCIDVTVTNRLPSNLSSSRPGSGYFGTLANVKLSTSLQVSLHPQQVGMDITTGNGVNIGKNPVQTVGPAKSTRLKWYAGSVAADGTHVPVELGAIGLSPADPLMQHPFGLLGALIIEPIGAAWHTDDNSRASATVTLPSGKLFREFVLVLQDDVSNLAWLLQPNLGDNFSRAINYATEPLPYRFTNPLWASTDPGLAPLGIARALSDSQALGDPQTPVLAVSKGTPTRLRVVHPGGLSEQAFALAGHSWQEEPFRNNSLEIGDNPASQSFGARDALGANDQFNIILNSAGGDNQVTGDYLYRTFIGTEFEFGLWGVMRVGEPGRDGVAIASVSNDLLRGSGYVVAGANTVNPDTGKMAKQVTITASVKPPDAIVPTLSTCTVPVDPVTGQWNAAAMKTLTEPFCPATSRGTLVVDAGHPVTVASSENGQASVTGFIPIPVVERILAEAVPRSSAEVVQTFERQMIQNKERLKNQNKELDQFLGERTPRATIQTPRAR